MKHKWRYLIFGLLAAAGTILAAVLGANYAVEQKTDSKVYDSVDTIPANHVGLLLGTSPKLGSGAPNNYFDNRITAAAELYHAGKIEYLVISGDNGHADYNEPQEMKQALVAQGVPAEIIYLDYAGFRTLDSVVRMKKIFGQTCFTVISQEFHNRRAICIASANGLDAVGFNAVDVTAYYGIKTKQRELLARVKMFLDLWIGKEPKFLGDPIKIGEN